MKLKSAFLFLFLFFPFFSQAETVYQTAVPTQEYLVDWPVVNSSTTAPTSRPLYMFYYSIPLGITFDRVQVSVPSSQGYEDFQSMTINTKGSSEPWFYSSVPSAEHYLYGSVTKTLALSSGTMPEAGTIEYLFTSSTTITNSNQFLVFGSKNNTDIRYNLGSFSTGASLNANSFVVSPLTPVLKFCNGPCDNSTFSAIPTLTAEPWVRMVSPVDGSVYRMNSNDVMNAYTEAVLNFEANTGTTSADSVVIRYNSQIQSLAPDTYQLLSTGLNTFSTNLNLPFMGDTIQIEASLMSGTTTLVVSPTYTLNVIAGDVETLFPPKSECNIEWTSLSSWFDCAGSWVLYMFVPTQSPVATLWETAYDEFSQTDFFSAIVAGPSAVVDGFDGYGSSTTTSSFVDMSIPIVSDGSIILDIPILSFSSSTSMFPSVFALFRSLSAMAVTILGMLVLASRTKALFERIAGLYIRQRNTYVD